MARLSSLDDLACHLSRRGLPAPYVLRVIGELRDHADDLTRASAATASDPAEQTGRSLQQLGDSRQLADTIVRQYRGARFVGRHPWCTFVLAPLFLPILAWAALMFGGAYLAEAICWLMPDSFTGINAFNPWATFVTEVIHRLLLLLPPLAVVWGICKFGTAAAMRRSWLIAGCMLVALLAYSVQTSLVLPSVPGAGESFRQLSGGTFMFGVGVSTRILRFPQLWQGLAPLAIAVWCLMPHRTSNSVALETA